jgi:hypothetical protein
MPPDVVDSKFWPDPLDLKFLVELEEHRGYIYLMNWVGRQRERWKDQYDNCTPEELPGLQGAIRALRLVEGGREHCVKTLRDHLANTQHGLRLANTPRGLRLQDVGAQNKGIAREK